MRLEHYAQVRSLAAQLAQASTQGRKVRFFHGASNSTRDSDGSHAVVDVRGLARVLEVNAQERYVVTEPNVPMDRLVKETLAYGMMPPVVMEFPGITVGGGIEGAALESSSFRNGQFSDACLEYEVVTASGEILILSPKSHPDLFYGMHGSYGSLCLLTSVKMRLVPAMPFVRMRYEPFSSVRRLLAAMERAIRSDTAYVEGIVFSSKRGVLITGRPELRAGMRTQTFSGASDPWFSSHVDEVTRDGAWEESVPFVDHLFRYNRGAFWMGELFFTHSGIPRNAFTTRLFNPFMNTRKLYEGLHECNKGHEFFIQDFYVPMEKAERFITYADRELGIYPIWLCPVKPTRHPELLSPHYSGARMLMDVGIYGQTPQYASDPLGVNRRFEEAARKIGGRKMLYAQQYYPEKEFWEIYDGQWYERLRKRYGADTAFPNVYEKTHVAKMRESTPWRGSWRMLLSLLRGKNLRTLEI